MDADNLNAIKSVYSRPSATVHVRRRLVLPIDREPLTPTNIMFKRAARRGCKTRDADGAARTLPIVEVDGAVLFIQRGGKALRELLWVDTEAHLRRKHFAVVVALDRRSGGYRHSPPDQHGRGRLRADGQQNGTWLFCAPFAIKASRVGRFVRQGKFLAVGVDGEWMYFAVQRTINGAVVVYMERFNTNHFMDAGVRAALDAPTGTLARLSHLEGETVQVRADGTCAKARFVTSGEIVWTTTRKKA